LGCEVEVELGCEVDVELGCEVDVERIQREVKASAAVRWSGKFGFVIGILKSTTGQSNVQTHNLLHNAIQVVIPMLAIVALNRHMHLTTCSIQTV
jgi:hypothetical protein